MKEKTEEIIKKILSFILSLFFILGSGYMLYIKYKGYNNIDKLSKKLRIEINLMEEGKQENLSKEVLNLCEKNSLIFCDSLYSAKEKLNKAGYKIKKYDNNKYLDKTLNNSNTLIIENLKKIDNTIFIKEFEEITKLERYIKNNNCLSKNNINNIVCSSLLKRHKKYMEKMINNQNKSNKIQLENKIIEYFKYKKVLLEELKEKKNSYKINIF